MVPYLRMIPFALGLGEPALTDRGSEEESEMTMTATATRDQAAITVLPARRQPTPVEEINHRIANSLQLLSAMISAQAREITDPAGRAALDATRRRMMAIAGVHRLLYQTWGAPTVDVADYIEQLSGWFEDMLGRRIAVDAHSLRVTAEEASAIGILLSELVTNASKYAYERHEPGEVRIALHRRPGGAYRLDVEDRGRGLGDGIKGTGLGSELIRLMVERLGGACEYGDARPGTRFTLIVGEG